MKTNKPWSQVNIEQQIPLKNWDKYKGSIVMTVDDRIYATTQPGKVPQMLKEIEKKHHKKPLITVVPKGDTLILIELNQKEESWQPITMIVDTGADYTLLPRFLAEPLGIDLFKDCKAINTQGVGGTSRVYLLKKRIRVRLGEFRREIPVGFLTNDYIPPLLGRQEFFESFKVVFEKLVVTFE